MGMWPSGKATGFDPVIRWFKSTHPSHYSPGTVLNIYSNNPGSKTRKKRMKGIDQHDFTGNSEGQGNV